MLCLLAGVAYGGYMAYFTYFAPTAPTASEQAGPRPVSVELARAELRVLKQTIEAVGTTRARQSVEIVPETEGRIVEINIKPGAQVAKGDVLARLDDTIERANFTEAEARLTQQRQSLDRINVLRKTNAVARASQEEATALLAEATAQLDRARRRLEERTIRAPFNGIVGLTDVDLGARVAEGDLLTRLDDLSEIEVEFSLPETLFAQIRPGQAISATSSAFKDREFAGRIEALDSRIDPVGRSFKTRAIIPNPDHILPAGMFMSITLTLSESNELVVPEEAIIFQAADTYVFVIKDGKALRQPVQTGQRLGGIVAVVSGLEQGDLIVVRGLQRVRDGSPVNVLGDDPTPAMTTDGGS